jgi:type I restriction enzyme R subunit
MSGGFAESDAEEAALGWLETLGYTVRHGPEIAYNVDGGERTDPGYHDTILQNRLHRALTRLNPGLPATAIFDAYRKVLQMEGTDPLARNRALHRMLVDGVNVEYTRSDGSIAGAQAQVIDFERPEQNDWLAVNQFTIVEGQQNRRADIVIFVNGLPLGVVELKNPVDENATVWDAVQQLENYQTLIPALFTYNAVLIASDGVQARIGALGAGKEWFKPWRTISGREDAGPGLPELQVVLAGVFQPQRFLDLVRHFIVFEDQGGGALAKKIAGYHQFHAVNVAVEETLRAADVAPEAAEAAGTYFARHTPGGEPSDRVINSPIRCMMKEIRTKCLEPHRDPVTGTETVVFSCFNQDQEMDRVDFGAVPSPVAELRPEKTDEAVIDRCLRRPRLVRMGRLREVNYPISGSIAFAAAA